ncbi:MAG: FKBP-type peptidyl-prolyl cis-trans isomerase [Chlorobi bacterium]|nr:FKBP-type peptidyl-prolyl cis-trans isomerase [Chlorobiota bacterium]
MKLFKSTAFVLLLAVAFTSCNKIPNTGDYELKNEIDSVSYALGFFGAKNVKRQSEQGPYKLDSAQLVKLAKLYSGVEMNDQFRKMLQGQFDTIDTKVYKTAFLNELAYGKSYFTEMTADTYLRKKYQEIKERKNAHLNEIAKANLEKGKKFLEENKKKEGVIETESGLQYEILKEGNGPKPKLTDKVKCHYKGTLIDGTQFDSSYDRGKPAVFNVNGVIKGWTEALQMMPVGSKWKLYIPADLAYGKRGSEPKIGPNETLIFEVELLEINPK